MPASFALPLRLRLASSAAFLLAVLIAAGAQRSLLMVPILAAASTGAHWLASRLAQGDHATLLAMLDPRTRRLAQQNIARAGFLFGLFGYAVIFIITVFLSALFTPTELARQLTGFDLGLILIPTLATLALGLIRGRVSPPLMTQPSDPPPEADAKAFILEGEIIPPEESES